MHGMCHAQEAFLSLCPFFLRGKYLYILSKIQDETRNIVKCQYLVCLFCD